MVGDMSFREGAVGSNPARVETEMSLKDEWPRVDSQCHVMSTEHSLNSQASLNVDWLKNE